MKKRTITLARQLRKPWKSLKTLGATNSRIRDTVLANERTFLSYVRTSLAVTVAGASLIQFFKVSALRLIGISMLPVGFTILVVGFGRYLVMREQLRRELDVK